MNTNCPLKSSDLANEIDKRIYDRNIPSSTLQPYINVRPAMTKYSIMPIVTPRSKPDVSMNTEATYNISKTFNPGNTQSPWSGFATNINLESGLRNQVYALQKCSQSTYVPQSSSDLYTERNPTNNPTIRQPFNDLFRNQQFNSFNPNCENVATNYFNNHTRTELRKPINKEMFHQ
jgi:hypothetical protein|tara:strand:- start:9317 stop:9844 length:528 start_codon:yes stop_codon:yes gene_type:complete